MKAVGEAFKKAAGKPGSQPAVEKPTNLVAERIGVSTSACVPIVVVLVFVCVPIRIVYSEYNVLQVVSQHMPLSLGVSRR